MSKVLVNVASWLFVTVLVIAAYGHPVGQPLWFSHWSLDVVSRLGHATVVGIGAYTISHWIRGL